MFTAPAFAVVFLVFAAHILRHESKLLEIDGAYATQLSGSGYSDDHAPSRDSKNEYISVKGLISAVDERINSSRKCPQISGLCTGEWVSFQIYGREDKDTGRPVNVANGTSNITDAGYTQDLPTAILIHGFADSSRSYLLVDIKNELLRNRNMKVIMMDWSKLVPGGCYFRSVYNVRYAGRCLSDLIISMKMPQSGLHVIGFSLGGHVPASAADFLFPYKIPRITGLDPALPLFWGYFSQRRLRKDDGIFVDVVHTNAFIEGHFLTLGHVDFFVNGGVIQPGCGSSFVDKVACSHSRSPMYYNESINTDVGFWGCTARYWNIESSCKPENIKWLMGYHVDTKSQQVFGKHITLTTPNSPNSIVLCFEKNMDASLFRTFLLAINCQKHLYDFS